jgi:hypothetical protein
MLGPLLRTVNLNVLTELFQEAERRRGGESPTLRFIVFESGGGQAGVIGATQEIVLAQHGLDIAIDARFGQSTGAAVSSYAQGGISSLKKGRIIYEDIVSGYRRTTRGRKFFEGFNFVSSPAETLDMDGLMYELRDGEYALDYNAVRGAKSDLYICTTNAQTAELVITNVKKVEEEVFWKLLEGSMTLPGVTNNFVEVEGVRHADGGAHSWPYAEMMNVTGFEPKKTRILVMPQASYQAESAIGGYLTAGEQFLESTALLSAGLRGNQLPADTLRVFADRHHTFSQGMRHAPETVYTFWAPPEAGLKSVGHGRDEVLHAEKLVEQDMEDILASAKPRMEQS